MALGFKFSLVTHDLELNENLGYMLYVAFLYVNPQSIKHFIISRILFFRVMMKPRWQKMQEGLKGGLQNKNVIIRTKFQDLTPDFQRCSSFPMETIYVPKIQVHSDI